jgi:glyoxylase-like metal-dependent hydrolase (beta-lactamase superfamily II)
MDAYEVYAVRYAGPFTRHGAFLMWHRDWEKTARIYYYIWCLKGPSGVVVVDAGVAPDLARDRQLDGYISPALALSGIGVRAEEVRHVILTHLHFDHSNGVTLFPNAAFYVQEQEYHFWLREPVAQEGLFRELADKPSQAYLASLEGTDRLVLVRGDREILPGIECLLAPGHTVALQAVAVNTARGTAVLGSDCAHLFRNYEKKWPTILITDLVGWMKSFDKLSAKAAGPDLLFPGHDVRMAENYPEVAEGVYRLV